MGPRPNDELAVRRDAVAPPPQAGWPEMEPLPDHDRIIANWYVDVAPGHSGLTAPGVMLTADFWRSAA